MPESTTFLFIVAAVLVVARIGPIFTTFLRVVYVMR